MSSCQLKSDTKHKTKYCKVIHIKLVYYLSDEDYLTMKLLQDGSIQFWAYHEEQYNIWDEGTSHVEMVIRKNELIPVLNYFKKYYEKYNTDEQPFLQIVYLYENYSKIDKKLYKVLQKICDFLQIPSDFILTDSNTIHQIFNELSEFFLKIFISQDASIKKNNEGFVGYYATLQDIKTKLISENLIKNIKLGKINL